MPAEGKSIIWWSGCVSAGYWVLPPHPAGNIAPPRTPRSRTLNLTKWTLVLCPRGSSGATTSTATTSTATTSSTTVNAAPGITTTTAPDGTPIVIDTRAAVNSGAAATADADADGGASGSGLSLLEQFLDRIST